MDLAAKLDEYGKPAWIALMVVGFIAFWPVGLAILFYLIWSGRMACWKDGGGAGRWYNDSRNRRAEKFERKFSQWWERHAPSSGNHAFDEYRNETLRRLEEEQKEFREFLDRLRHAKDKAEFDQFMSDRGRRPAGQEPHPQPQA